MKKKLILPATVISAVAALMVCFVSCASAPQRHDVLLGEPVEFRSLNFSKDGAVKDLSVEQLEEDVDMLEYLFKTSYVLYDRMSADRVFDFDKSFDSLRKECRASGGMKYGVFQKAIRAHLTEIPDYHISLVRSDGVFEPVVNRRSLYATGIIVHRESDGSLVSRSSLGSVVKQGMKVRVPQENLFKTYSAEGDTYLVGVFSYDSPQKMQILVEVTDGLFETKEIAVSCWNAITWNNTFSVDDGEQFLYRIDSFSFDSDERKQKLEQFASSGTSVHGKKMLVIDLRNNWGGDLLYQLCFLSGLTSNVIYTPEKKEECVSYKDSFGTQLLSPAILQSMLFMSEKEELMNKHVLKDAVAYSKEKPLKYYSTQQFISPDSIKMPATCPDFDGTLILLINGNSCSASDWFYRQVKPYAKTIVVGSNSCGAVSSGNPYPYQLPNSKITVNIPSMASCWVRDDDFVYDLNDGLIPDYWVASDAMLYDTLRSLGVSERLISALETGK